MSAALHQQQQQQQQQQRNLLQGLPASNQRQLDMIIANQNNPASMNFAKFNPQQTQLSQRPDQPQQSPFLTQGMNQSPADIFSGPGMNDALRRGSPSHPPNINPAMPSNLMSQQPRRQLSAQELNDRAAHLRLQIQAEENVMNNLTMQTARGGPVPPELVQRLNAVKAAVAQKKEILHKIVQSLAAQNPSGL